MLPHASRWRTVFLKGSAADWEKVQATKGQFSMLEHPHLVVTSTLTFDLDAFEGAPSLRHLTFFVGIQVERLRFTWVNITTLELSGIAADEIIKVLDRYKNVEMCRFHGVTVSRPPAILRQITLPRLHTAVFVMPFPVESPTSVAPLCSITCSPSWPSLRLRHWKYRQSG
ncbi:hypothetical protein AX16_006970 [Volvariella volvacea WC 439]|nr:hypothetical protein AX16_006970 [Volvariella volvacea WC 439]